MSQPTPQQQELLQLLQKGINHHLANQRDEAEKIYRHVLQSDPENPDGLHLLGVLEAQRGNNDVALQLLTRAVTRLPNVGEFQRHLGDTLAALGRRDEALSAFLRAAQLSPNDPAALTSAGEILLFTNRAGEAVEMLRRAAELQPQVATAFGNWAAALTAAGRIPEALGVLQHAMNLDPNSGPVWVQFAEALWHQHRFDEALKASQRAVELTPNDPRTYIILGNTFQVLARFDEALDAYRAAERLAPNSRDVANNIGLTLLKIGRATEALDVLDKGHARWPTHSGIGGNLGLALLTLGQFERGWDMYEMRFQSPAFKNHSPVAKPKWDGGDIAGKTILLTMEQGIGDAIQFARYAPLLAERGAKVLVASENAVAPVLATVEGVNQIVTREMRDVAFDVHAPLASLPRLFKTDLDSIPARVPYVRADEARVARWRERMASHDGFKVGLVWAGNPTHQNDRSRSMTLAAFASLAEIEGVTLFSLQKGNAASELAGPPKEMNIVDVGPELNDFADTAALLECLDLLISVDTSVVHLGGALARPVWALLAAGPDWRWLLGRDDSPWYPTLRLFRQPTAGDWDSVMKSVSAELRAMIGNA